MSYYGGKEMAESFRTVRQNTIQIARGHSRGQIRLPRDAGNADHRRRARARGVRDVVARAGARRRQEDLHHVRRLWRLHGSRGRRGKEADDQKRRHRRAHQERRGVRAVSRAADATKQLAERVSFPPPVQPSTKTRFEMLLGAKEHEMHHRGKLMVIERLIGIVPHLTRARQQRQRPSKADEEAVRGQNQGLRPCASSRLVTRSRCRSVTAGSTRRSAPGTDRRSQRTRQSRRTPPR